MNNRRKIDLSIGRIKQKKNLNAISFNMYFYHQRVSIKCFVKNYFLIFLNCETNKKKRLSNFWIVMCSTRKFIMDGSLPFDR